MVFRKIDRLFGHSSNGEGVFFTTRRSVLYTRVLALIGTAILLTLIKEIIDQGLAPLPMAIFILFLVVLTAVGLNKLGKQKASKILFLLLMNLIIGILCSVIPKERFAFIFFFPLIIMAFVIFEDSESRWRNVFIFVSATILLSLVLADFRLLGDYQLTVSEWGNSNFITNVIVSILITTLCMNFLVETNKKSEKALRDQANDIEVKNKELQKINSELDRFVYSASHDLRSPLLSIQGLTTVAIAESTDEGDRKYFSLIQERIVKLDEFIKEIIEYSKNSRTELRIEKYETKKLIHEVIENLKYLHDALGILFVVECSVNEMTADKNRIAIILSNIIANAIKYHNPRSARQFVKVSVDQVAGAYVLKIEDNGMGIAEDSLSRIFEMFYRATEKSSGSGLGLYIVKEIVQKLVGEICVQSQLGKGSLFTIKIPITKER
jgi:hypothetical protein